jgi:hypothetical protein
MTTLMILDPQFYVFLVLVMTVSVARQYLDVSGETTL